MAASRQGGRPAKTDDCPATTKVPCSVGADLSAMPNGVAGPSPMNRLLQKQAGGRCKESVGGAKVRRPWRTRVCCCQPVVVDDGADGEAGAERVGRQLQELARPGCSAGREGGCRHHLRLRRRQSTPDPGPGSRDPSSPAHRTGVFAPRVASRMRASINQANSSPREAGRSCISRMRSKSWATCAFGARRSGDPP